MPCSSAARRGRRCRCCRTSRSHVRLRSATIGQCLPCSPSQRSSPRPWQGRLQDGGGARPGPRAARRRRGRVAADGLPRQPSELLRLRALRQQRRYLALGGSGTGPTATRSSRALPRRAPLSTRGTCFSRAPVPRRADAADHAPADLLPRLGPAEPVDRLLAHYREAERRFGVPWNVLAAVNFVETAFGKGPGRRARRARGGRCSSCRPPGARTDSAATSTTRATRFSAPPTFSVRPGGRVEPPPVALRLQPFDPLRRCRARIRARPRTDTNGAARVVRLARVRADAGRLPGCRDPLAP